MPFKFTGKWGGQYYYKGVRWFGPTNLIGYRKGRPFRLVVVDVVQGFLPS